MNSNENQKTPSPQCRDCCLKIENLSVTLERKEIIKDINLHVHCGELIAIVGPNGAGKTTLMKSIIGEVRFSGSMKFLNRHKAATKKSITIGYTPQKLWLEKNNPITVLDLFIAKISKRPVCFAYNQEDIKKVEEILSLIQVKHLLHHKLGNLSGGELQRTLLAYSLCPIPNVLLLDEPIAGIDQEGMKMFYNIVSDLRLKLDLSIILITHDLDSVASHANGFIFLDKTIKYYGDYPGLKKFLDSSERMI